MACLATLSLHRQTPCTVSTGTAVLGVFSLFWGIPMNMSATDAAACMEEGMMLVAAQHSNSIAASMNDFTWHESLSTWSSGGRGWNEDGAWVGGDNGDSDEALVENTAGTLSIGEYSDVDRSSADW